MLRALFISLISIFYLFVSSCSVSAQDLLLFIESNQLLDNEEIGGPLSRAFADINGDYRDDIIRLNGINILYADIASNNGEKFYNQKLSNITGDVWTIGIADIDNNGFNDIVTSGTFNGASIWYTQDAELNFTQERTDEFEFFSQASNFVDINNDGWLDLFICNDIGLNKIFLNDGTGQLVEDSDYIDMTTAVPSDNSGNYASEWTDVDGDGDLDLHIAKCKLNVFDFTDPTRINALFINENGSFVERAEEFGIAIGAQSWTGNFGDIDNDGDMDLFLTNHDFRCQLFENIENDTFVEIQYLPNGEELNFYAYQSTMQDFNNDGLLDILITGDQDFMLVNQGNNIFQKLENPFGFVDAVSIAVGDANNDGWLDVICSYNPLGINEFVQDKLFTNLTNENHYLTISLKGTVSNASGIGSRLEIYGDWGVQTRIVQSGTGYGITNTLNSHFGINDHSSIDSLIIYWPSGTIDKYEDLASDRHLLAIEKTCLEEIPDIKASDSILDCINQSIELTHELTSDVIWSTGELSDTIIVESPSFYYAQFNIDENCQVPSQSIRIDSLSLPEKPELNIIDTIQFCSEEVIRITSRNSQLVNWPDGTRSTEYDLSDSQILFANNSNYCDTIYSDTLLVNRLDPDASGKDTMVIIDTIQDIDLTVEADQVRWYSDQNAESLIKEGNAITLEQIDQDTTIYYEITNNISGISYIGGELIQRAETDDEIIIPTASVTQDFSVYDTCTISGFNVKALIPGIRRIQIYESENRLLVFENDYEINEGINFIEIGFLIYPGQYYIQTSESLNLSNFGTSGPGLSLVNGSMNYPYEIADLLSIEDSNLGNTIFGYFFDWIVKSQPGQCNSSLFKFDIDFDPLSSVYEINSDVIQYAPIPCNEYLNIRSESQIDHVELYDLSGRRILQLAINDNSTILDLNSIKAGNYILRLTSGKTIHSKRIIKI